MPQLYYRIVPASIAMVGLTLCVAACVAQTKTAPPPASPTCPSCAVWNAPRKPFRIYGNSYWVGTNGLGSILIVSHDGDILIDGGTAETAPIIEEHIKELGFRIEDVKLLLNTHVHYDHAGGLAELQRASGAGVAASPSSADVLRRGSSGPDDPQFGILPTFAPVRIMKTVSDAETVRIGTLAMTAHYTPGHTPGGTTWSWVSCENEKCLNIVYADSQTPVSSDDFLFTKTTTYPSAIRDFEHSAETLDRLPCDILLTPHPEASRLWERLAARDGGNPLALVNPNACRDYAATARAAVAQRIAREKAKGG
jgi:metallo-beta-lactamase class B